MKNNYDKNKGWLIIIIPVSLLTLVIVDLRNNINWKFFTNIFRQKEIRYEKCIKSCEEHKVCTKTVEKEKTEYSFGFGIKECSEYNTGECYNICISKYK